MAMATHAVRNTTPHYEYASCRGFRKLFQKHLHQPTRDNTSDSPKAARRQFLKITAPRCCRIRRRHMCAWHNCHTRRNVSQSNPAPSTTRTRSASLPWHTFTLNHYSLLLQCAVQSQPRACPVGKCWSWPWFETSCNDGGRPWPAVPPLGQQGTSSRSHALVE
jgi:hypothetical protein